LRVSLTYPISAGMNWRNWPPEMSAEQKRNFIPSCFQKNINF
jgi:hypothetical protein